MAAGASEPKSEMNQTLSRKKHLTEVGSDFEESLLWLKLLTLHLCSLPLAPLLLVEVLRLLVVDELLKQFLIV